MQSCIYRLQLANIIRVLLAPGFSYSLATGRYEYFTANLNCVMVIIDSHRLYFTLASLYLSPGWNKCATSFLAFALLSYKKLFRDSSIIT